MNRDQRLHIAQQTLAIQRAGRYSLPDGSLIDLSHDIKTSIHNTHLIHPSDWPATIDRARSCPPATSTARIEVANESTLSASRRLIQTQNLPTLALNFASARNPGGGFLTGAQAQEESLARSSALYLSLEAAPDYYTANRKCSSLLYTDHAIFSPQVPVFRDDDGTLLPNPYLLSFLTMPAPNAGAIPPNHPDLQRLAETLEHRARCVLALAALESQRALVLGAWGCGVFRNDPNQVASIFHTLLLGPENWSAHFQHITFAVLDRSPDQFTYHAFQETFA